LFVTKDLKALAMPISIKPKGKYETRYCAFVDILGFRGMIAGLRPGTTNFELLHGLLEIIHTKNYEAIPVSGIRAQSISDAVAISTDATDDGIRGMVHAIESVSMKLLHEGYFVRGAIVKGSLYHDEKMVFGSALVKAYELESSVVHFPRIMLTQQVYADMLVYDQGRRSEWLQEHVRQGEDGPRFMHTLYTAERDIGKAYVDQANTTEPFGGAVLAKYDLFREQIQKRFDEAVDNPKHFEKVKWFANYWNDCARFGTLHQKALVGPGLGQMTWTKQ
jgi:hypothetical protein